MHDACAHLSIAGAQAFYAVEGRTVPLIEYAVAVTLCMVATIC